MTMGLDTLAYARHLKSSGVPVKQAEAHAEATQEHVMSQVATKADIAELKGTIERQSLVLTVRLGGLMVAGLAGLATLMRLSA